MKIYIVINPLTNKPTQFSLSQRGDLKFAETYIDSENKTQIRFLNAIFKEVEYDENLLTKTYNPNTDSLE